MNDRALLALLAEAVDAGWVTAGEARAIRRFAEGAGAGPASVGPASGGVASTGAASAGLVVAPGLAAHFPLPAALAHVPARPVFRVVRSRPAPGGPRYTVTVRVSDSFAEAARRAARGIAGTGVGGHPPSGPKDASVWRWHGAMRRAVSAHLYDQARLGAGRPLLPSEEALVRGVAERELRYLSGSRGRSPSAAC